MWKRTKEGFKEFYLEAKDWFEGLRPARKVFAALSMAVGVSLSMWLMAEMLIGTCSSNGFGWPAYLVIAILFVCCSALASLALPIAFVIIEGIVIFISFVIWLPRDLYGLVSRATISVSSTMHVSRDFLKLGLLSTLIISALILLGYIIHVVVC